jgi:large-conductance mechanosensitive channel
MKRLILIIFAAFYIYNNIMSYNKLAESRKESPESPHANAKPTPE